MRITIYLLRTISIVSILYFIIIIKYSGIRTSFLWFWICLSSLSFLFSILLKKLPKISSWNTTAVTKILLYSFWIVFLFFLIIEGIIYYHGKKAPISNADYLIVLGAQVRGNQPSKTLEARIKQAATYLKQHSNTIAICSGGQGPGELITEASAIKKGLISLGIEPNRILLEETSTNTVENILRSKILLPHRSELQVVLVTSDFHVFRAKHIAKKQGLTDVSTYGASEFTVTTLNYYVREFFAVIKDLLTGNLAFL